MPLGGQASKESSAGVWVPAAVLIRFACCASGSSKISSMPLLNSIAKVSPERERTSHESNMGDLSTAHNAMCDCCSAADNALGPLSAQPASRA